MAAAMPLLDALRVSVAAWDRWWRCLAMKIQELVVRRILLVLLA
jgi:hypothetical protein